MGLKNGTTYPLLDPERYDDDLGEGYGFAQVYGQGGEPENGWYVADCWIVNEAGEVHPGYDQQPVPIRADDVALDRGFATKGKQRRRGDAFSFLG